VVTVLAADSPAPLSTWRDGNLVYASATALPMTAVQARAAAQDLINHAHAIEHTDPHAGKVESLARWVAERKTLPRSESISNSFARRVTDRPVLSATDQLALSLSLRDEPATDCRAVG
jgi:hypothetical protein